MDIKSRKEGRSGTDLCVYLYLTKPPPQKFEPTTIFHTSYVEEPDFRTSPVGSWPTKFEGEPGEISPKLSPRKRPVISRAIFYRVTLADASGVTKRARVAE